ncbi:PREDICTED: E3 ubiquitin-protein ligase TRIM11-like [Nanorana parkeri]|uniref:E3 ubiquitin-protein ligase TRIM11-like n=1 Tax=Nanorana parkeri TaxID=125878 RepID=UPI00085415EF|nr:PREDICTED: E3 ubiquitin-protein ligase TRIM11-like [Nanorana parkeri]
MAAAAALQQELKCCICLNIYSEPTTLPCGHTFCKQCIQKTFQTSDQRSCPECRRRLPPQMELNRNTKMCSLIEHLTSAKSKSAKDQGGCSYCEETAEKLCLDCETPLCGDHLKKHKDSAGHVLIDLSTKVQSRKCATHKEVLKYYCTEEGVNVCASCGLIGDHKQHKLERLCDLAEKEKSALEPLEDLLTKKRSETEEKVALVKSHKEKVAQKSHNEAVRNLVIGVIGDLKKELESVEHQILSQITTQEDQVLTQVSQVVKTLEGQISEINDQIREIQNLRGTSDPLNVLERKASEAGKAKTLINAENDFYVKKTDVGMDLVLMQSSIHRFTKRIPFLLKTRGFYTEDATCRLLPFSQIAKNVPPFLILTLEGQSGDGPRSAFSASTLSSGQYYWEVETSDKPLWAVGVSYRNEDYEALGFNADSWCLKLTDDKQYRAVHDSHEVIVATGAPVKALGVYMEYEPGILSFYQVSNNGARYLCSMHAKFTQPLHMVMYVEHGGWLRIRK